MAKFSRNFIAGRMNKVVDERLLPEGEYIDALNIRMGSTEKSEIGVIENTKGNLPLTELAFRGTLLSLNARCIGTLTDSAREMIYWFVHDPTFTVGAVGKCDMILSYNVFANILTYHLISIDDGSGLKTTLNFNPQYLITGVDIIEDLLFWTDDLNQPRFINVKRNYPTPNLVTNIDSFEEEEILVIKRPPANSPEVSVISTSGQENFLETRFISFAYRYRYEDGEYSATSQWSDIAFLSKPFEFSPNSMLNEGMVNAANTAIIKYDSGGPLVKGVDLLFKESNNNVVRIIEKLDKDILGLSSNTVYQYTFNNSKIFTILNEAELLRLYDNVPLLAKAQTIMGNRLMYGNYVEGYDLVDKDSNPVRLEYQVELVSKSFGESEIPDSFISGNYTINGPVTINNSILVIDLVDKPLQEGAAINIQFSFNHSQFSGQTPFPTETTNDTALDFTFYLQTNYNSVYELATSAEFQQEVGTITNIKPVYSSNPLDQTSCEGTTFTDDINCNIPQNLGPLTKFASGISAINQAINIITSPGSSEIGFQIIAMQYVDDPNAITQIVYEYYQFSFAEATYLEVSNPRSLHSNRGYEIGIVYMDDFKRSTTALVSANNAIYVPCGNCSIQNEIQVTIPPQQIAPYWATSYKFVIKPDSENYEVIYSNFIVKDEVSNEVWLQIEGENIKKVQIGDRYIVKKDTSGPMQTCSYATVLDKVEKAENFISGKLNPPGIYMKMLPNSFETVIPLDSVLNYPFAENCAPKGGNYSHFRRTVNVKRTAGFDPTNPLWEYEDLSIPAGSRVEVYLNWNRQGVGNPCERRGYEFGKNFTSLRDYDNFKDWWDGDNISTFVTQYGTSKDGSSMVEYIQSLGFLSLNDFETLYIQFDRNTVTNELIFQMSTGRSCTGVGYKNSRKYCAGNSFKIFRSVTTLVFETLPQDAQPDIFYENNLSFGIDANGNHLGNIQNQDIATNTPAIIDTQFFNCYVFGNGVESYKIRDSLIGKSFNLGERVTSVSQQEYKQTDRFADITYSGVFNAETNVNRLNEFNFGLLNFKNCEVAFGAIYILDARETDVLVLQEEKISYVLAGKNLLSDSTGGGVVSSVPEVLGTQIARTEKYGISFNPESYVHWGFNRFFTDVKRGAVLQLVGDSYSNEQLKVISEANMRTWFRDEFNRAFNTQKLGGYDPYMDEYVLTTNDREIPIDVECLNCGTTPQTFTFNQESPLIDKSYKYCVELGPLVGNTTISWSVASIVGGQFQIKATYNGSTVSSPFTTTSGTLSFNKDEILVTEVEVEIVYNASFLKLNVVSECPLAEDLTIIQVVVTSLADVGKTIHAEYRYVNGSYTSPIQSNLVSFASGTGYPIVSRYNSITGPVGSGGFPPENSLLTINTNQISPDNYVFNPAQDKFRYLRSNILYQNNATDIIALLGASIVATPITGGGTIFKSTFNVPLNTLGDKLYLIWDLRDIVPIELCVGPAVPPTGNTPQRDACCECSFVRCEPGEGVVLVITNTSSTQNAEVLFPLGTDGFTPLSVELDPSESFGGLFASNPTGSAIEVPFTVVSGTVTVEKYGCGVEDYLKYAEAVGLTQTP